MPLFLQVVKNQESLSHTLCKEAFVNRTGPMDFILRLSWDYPVLNAILFWCRRPSRMLSEGKLLLQTDRLKNICWKADVGWHSQHILECFKLLDTRYVISVTEGITLVSFRPSPYTGLSFQNIVCTISLHWGPRTGKERVAISGY